MDLFMKMKIKWDCSIVLGLIIILMNSGCLFQNERVPQINDCVDQPSFRGLSCEGVDSGQAIVLRQTLKWCSAQNLLLQTSQFCLDDLPHQFSLLTNSNCQDVFVDHVRCVMKKNIKGEISHLIQAETQNDGTGNPQFSGRISGDGLGRFLENLGNWYNRTLNLLYMSEAMGRAKAQYIAPDPALSEEERKRMVLLQLADQDQRDLLDTFWGEIIKNTKSDTLLQRRLDFIQQNAASLQVAEGTLSQLNYPAPLYLRLLGNSLKMLSQRVHYLASIADLGCQIDSCRGNTGTELFRIISLLGSMGSRQEYEALIPEIDRIDARIAPLFRAAARSADSIERNIVQFIEEYGGSIDAYRQNHEILQVNLDSVPDFARDVLEIIQSNRILRNSYQTSGYYSRSRTGMTEFGFSSNLDAIKNITDLASHHFTQKLNEFRASRQNYGREILAEQNWQNSIAQLKAQRDRQIDVINEIGQDLNGLKASLSSVQSRVMEYIKNVTSVLNTESYQRAHGSRYVVEHTSPPFEIRPQQAPLNSKSSLIADLVVDSVRPIRLNKGQIASISVQRNWSPTCGLRRNGFSQEVVNGALIGPEGFMIGTSQGRAQIHSVTDYERNDATRSTRASVSVCHQASLGIIGEIFGQQPSIRTCLENSFGQSSSQGRNTDDVNTQESRQQASFNMGIRSAWSPFEKFPVGSLLVAQVKRDGNLHKDSIVSIEVAQRANQILASQDVDLYFIVNDCNDPGNINPEALQVSYEVLTQEGELARQVSLAMADGITHIDSKIDSILLQGDVSPQQIQTLREEMNKKLAEHPQGRSRQTLGPVLSEFYQFWVENELLQLEKKSRIRRLERNMKVEFSNLKRIEAEMNRTESLEKLYELQKLWTLDSLDIAQFTSHLNEAIENLNRFIIPVISFQAPERITDLKRNPNVMFLRDRLNLISSVDEIADHIRTLYTTLSMGDNLNELVFRGWESTNVVLSFPKPELLDLNDEDLIDHPLSLWKKGPRTMTEQIWSAFLGTGSSKVSLSLDPEDLYDPHQRLPDTLDCTKLSPVIESMGLYFMTEDEVGVGIGAEYEFNLALQAKGALRFPDEKGFQDFVMKGESREHWLNQSIPYTMGPRRLAKSVLEKANVNRGTGTGSAAGLSPFMNFSFDFTNSAFAPKGSLEAHRDPIREILVVFKLKYRPSLTGSLDWMPACAALYPQE